VSKEQIWEGISTISPSVFDSHMNDLYTLTCISTSCDTNVKGSAWNSMSQVWGINYHMRSHSVTYLRSTCREFDSRPCTAGLVNAPHLDPCQTCWYLIYLPGGMEGWVDRWPVTYIDVCSTRQQTAPSTNPAVHGRESNSRHVDLKSDALTTTPPRRMYQNELNLDWTSSKPLNSCRRMQSTLYTVKEWRVSHVWHAVRRPTLTTVIK